MSLAIKCDTNCIYSIDNLKIYQSEGISDESKFIFNNSASHLSHYLSAAINSDITNKLKNIEKLNQLRLFQDNWNGYGANKFSKELINKCRNILRSIIKQPKIFPTAQNSIQFEYQLDNGKYLEFEIFEEYISLFMIDSNEEEYQKIIRNDISIINEELNTFYG